MVPPSPTTIKTATAPVVGVEPQVLESQDLIASLPAPIFRLLVIFARPISVFRQIAEILCWNPHRRVESWMVVGLWWGLCLGAGHVFKWLLPGLIFMPLVPLSTLRLRGVKSGTEGKDGMSKGQSTNTESVLLTLNDLHSIHGLLPPSPIPDISSIYARFRQLGPLRLVRGLGVIWTTWIILGHIVGFRALLAIAGSIILLLPSPTLAHTVDLLSKSLAIRRSVALIFLFIFGSPPEHSYRMSLEFSPMGWMKSKWATSRRPSLAFSFRPTFDTSKGSISGSAIVDDEDEMKEENPIYFKFEVHENHRWWMGLDWTSALLPQERPSWCDSHLLPVSPPASFSLPPPASIVLPAPTKADPQAKVRRTATWKWLDDDWSIVRAGQSGQTIIQPTPAPIPESDSLSLGTHIPRSLSMSLGSSPPHMQEETTGSRTQSIAEQAFTKGLERLKARTISPQGKPPSPRSSVELVRPRTGSQASEDLEPMQGMTGAAVPASQVPMETIRERDDATDAEGWVYGDNKWENMGAKGGLGRFTRRRRWHRRAVCTEIVQKIPSEHGRTPVPPLKAAPVVETIPVLSTASTTAMDDLGFKVDREPKSTIPATSGSGVRDDVLRQRLKKAMGSMGG